MLLKNSAGHERATLLGKKIAIRRVMSDPWTAGIHLGSPFEALSQTEEEFFNSIPHAQWTGWSIALSLILKLRRRMSTVDMRHQ